MPSYLFSTEKQITEKKNRKERLNRKDKEKPYLSPRREQPSQPSRPTRGSGVFFPVPCTQAARWKATEPAVNATSPPRALQASPCPLPSPGDASRPSRSIPPPPPALPP